MSEHKPSEPFPVGDAIARSFQLWIRNVIPFSVLAAVPAAAQFPFAIRMADVSGNPRLGSIAAVLLISLISGAFLTATFIAAILEQLRGSRLGLGSALQTGLARTLPVLGVNLLLGLLCGAVAAPVMVLGALGGFFLNEATDNPIPGMLLIMVSMVLALALVVLIVGPLFYWAVPIVVAERNGVLDAFRRSLQLSRGSRPRLVAVALVVVGTLVLFGLVGGLLSVLFGDTEEQQQLIQTAVTVPLTPLASIAPAVIYFHLRRIKEGVDEGDLEQVFA